MKLRMRSERRHLVVSLAVLLALFGAGLGESLFHTDDGCAVEVHCTACMLAIGTAGASVAGAAVTPSPSLCNVGLVCPLAAVSESRGQRPGTPSRAPPLA